MVGHDRVIAKDPSFTKTWQLNTAGQPYLDDHDTFMALNGTAKLAGRTFLPENPKRSIWGSNQRPFFLAGHDLHHHSDFTGFPVTPGGWIIRVSPPEANLEDEFLHLLAAGRARDTVAELLAGWRLVEAEGAAVLAGDQAVLVFPQDAGEEKISFQGPGSGEKLRAYVLGVPNDALYAVEIEGAGPTRTLSPVDGVLNFELRGKGPVVVRKVEGK